MSDAMRSARLRVEWAHRAYEQARTQRLEAERVAAKAHQYLIDHEVRETRRLLLWELRSRYGRDAIGFVDEDFLTVADEATTLQAIMIAAATVGAADLVAAGAAQVLTAPAV